MNKINRDKIEQINALIAEACGWIYYDGWNHPDGRNHLPDYCIDLNSMHEAEKVLTSMQQEEYWDFLWNLTGSEFELCHANAHQRAEAFLRTLGKWEE
jgi:hypothetical protein